MGVPVVSLDDILTHYGIKGMRWGVRRTPEQLQAARGVRPWERRRVDKINRKAKKQGVQSLSDKELKTATDRLRAEKQYSQLLGETNAFTRGHEVAKKALTVGGTLSAAYALATSPMAKAGYSFVAKQLKS